MAAKKPIDLYRRNLQKSYINILDNLLNPGRPNSSPDPVGGLFSITIYVNTDKSDIRSAVRAHLAALRTEVNAAAAATADTMTRYHLQDISKRIDNALDPKQ